MIEKNPVGKARAKKPAASDGTRTLTEVRADTPNTPGAHKISSAAVTPSGNLGEILEGSPLPAGDPERYEITSEYARGGLGRILEANDQSLGRTVAVKELLERSPISEQRFVREALITARLQHPGIVPVHEAGRWPSGDPYYVMKLISGDTLKQLIAQCDDLEQRLALLPNAIAVADAIAYAHSEGIIHRDIKPSNVVVGEFGETVVIDWGLAKDLRAASAANDEAPASGEGEGDEPPRMSTQSGSHSTNAIIGTPAYMPPEQATGDLVDERADVYATGALLYHMLTGRTPYAGTDSDKLLPRVIEGPPMSIAELEPGVPSDLVAIVEKAMDRDPSRRYANAKALADDLKRFQTGKVVTAQQYSTMALVRRWLGRHKGGVALTLGTLAMASALGVLGLNRIIDERNTARSERAQARAAQIVSEEKRNELLFLQAKSSLLRDPTAAVAWLKRYPVDGPRFGLVPAMAEDARARGVSTHVFEHGSWVFQSVFVDNNRRLATVAKDGKVRLWDLSGKKSMQVLGETVMEGSAIAAASTRPEVAFGNESGVIAIVNVETGARRELRGPKSTVGGVRYTDNDASLIVGYQGDAPHIWDVASGTSRPLLERTENTKLKWKYRVGEVNATGSVVAEVEGTTLRWRPIAKGGAWAESSVPQLASTRRLAVSPSGTLVGAISVDGTVRTVNIKTGAVRELGSHPRLVEHIEYSPTGRYLVTTGADTTIRLWDVVGEKHRVLRGHEDSIYMFDFSHDETKLVSAGDDGTARLWDLQTGAVNVLRGHSDDVYRVVFSADATLVASSSLDGTVRVWPTRFDDAKVLYREGETFVATVKHLSDGRVLSQSLAGELVLWDSKKPDQSEVLGKAWPGEFYPDWQRKLVAVVSPHGEWAASPNEDGLVDVWNTRTRKKTTLSPPDGIERAWGGESALSISGDGRLAAIGTGRQVIEWSLADGKATSLDLGAAYALTYAADGSLTVIGDRGLSIRDKSGVVKVEPIKSGADSLRLKARMLFVSPSGRRIAMLERRGRVVVFDRTTRETSTYDAGGNTLLGLAFSADGSRLAAASADRTVRVWNTETGEATILEGHTDLVHSVAFSPDGKTLGSSSYDKTVRLWNLATRSARLLRGHTHSVDAFSFSEDGTEVASAGRDGTVRIWRISATPATAPADVRSALDSLTTATISAGQPATSAI